MTAAASEPRSEPLVLADLPALRDLVTDECLYPGHVSPVHAAVLAMAPARGLRVWSCQAVRSQRGARVLLRLGMADFLMSAREALVEADTLSREVVELQVAWPLAREVARALLDEGLKVKRIQRPGEAAQ